MPAFGPWIPRAAVQSEDAWFFHHHGFDFHAVEKALADAEDGLPSRGASTISQQVAKNVFLWQGDGLVSRVLRKGLELPLTVLLELLVPKTRILEIYLNIAETGPMVFGFEAGAQHHFGKSADKLSATEAARLVAVLPNPRVWKPTGGYAGKRAARILRNSVPFPGEAGFDGMSERAGEHAWPWGLVDVGR
jgi:monofunctional biosynthetic peptidoglycan transglycosylase